MARTTRVESRHVGVGRRIARQRWRNVGAGALLAASCVAWAVACSDADDASAPVTPAADAAANGDSGFPNVDPTQEPRDASQASIDASPDADAEAGVVVQERVAGHVEHNGTPLGNAKVTVLAPASQITSTDASGDFFFYAPVGSVAIFEVEATDYVPMVRGVTVQKNGRIRVFYMTATSELAVATQLGQTVDPAKGIVEVDFRNANVGGYGATMKNAQQSTVTPGFGIVYDQNGDPQLSMTTVTGGDGTTLLLGNVPPDTVSFTPTVPMGGACTPCDAPTIPIRAGTITWYDFECGNANCQ